MSESALTDFEEQLLSTPIAHLDSEHRGLAIIAKNKKIEEVKRENDAYRQENRKTIMEELVSGGSPKLFVRQ